MKYHGSAEDGEAQWQQVGGDPVLELANTVSWRLDATRRRDLLTTPERLREWAGVHLVELPWAKERATEASLSAVQELRGHLIAVLDAHADQTPVPTQRSRALVVVASQYIGAAAGPASLPLELAPARVTDTSLAGILAVNALDLLRGSRLVRTRRCAGVNCGWFFLDRTKNSRRRWCQATGCGNLARTRRYTARRRATRTDTR